MSFLMINSKVKLGCNICDKCCINRGDIKLTPINVIQISEYLNISIPDFLEKYTNKLEDEPLEIVLKPIGIKKRCILNDEKTNMCTIHSVKPMQCVTFPLVPVDLKNDIFFNQDTCVCDEIKEMKVIDWLNGKNGIYVKYKKIYLEWIELIENLQQHWDEYSQNEKDEIYKILFLNYRQGEKNIKKAVRKNFRMIKKMYYKK